MLDFKKTFTGFKELMVATCENNVAVTVISPLRQTDQYGFGTGHAHALWLHEAENSTGIFVKGAEGAIERLSKIPDAELSKFDVVKDNIEARKALIDALLLAEAATRKEVMTEYISLSKERKFELRAGETMDVVAVYALYVRGIISSTLRYLQLSHPDSSWRDPVPSLEPSTDKIRSIIEAQHNHTFAKILKELGK